MPNYSKQTVAQLRQLLKERSIPSTGLTRKAQIIEKLEEADSAGADASDASKDNNADEAASAEQKASVSASEVHASELALPEAEGK